MSEGILSQAELDALLAAQAEQGLAEEPAGQPVEELSPETRDAVGEVGNISLGAAATALSKLVNRKVSITTPRVRVVAESEITRIAPPEQVLIRVEYSEGLRGSSLFLIRQRDAVLIANLMMGGPGSSEGVLDEVRLSAVAEAMNQMMGAAVTAMAGVLRERITITPPMVKSVNLSNEADAEAVAALDGERMVEAAFTLRIEDLVESEFIQILPLELSKQLVSRFYELTMAGAETAAPPPAPAPPVAATAAQAGQAAASAATASPPAASYAGPAAPAAPTAPGGGEERGGFSMMGEYGPKSGVVVQAAQFAPLANQPVARPNPNLQLLMDVQLQVTVELGRTKMLIRDILELAKGSVVELEKFAGEPVDILVNGKLVAKGEVVVIDENFGVKVVDIVTPAERIQGLQ
ncbi:MAG: flagellar motor switch phosphatase FliY [Bacillota bacterium]|nr:flagellar motor switch phosphatase FliY [Bacillota bacterium]